MYNERGEGKRELLFDYVAGLTDTFAIEAAKEILGAKQS